MSTDYRGGTPKTLRRLLRCLIIILLMLPIAASAADQGALVAAASSLRTLWPNLMSQYVKDTGDHRARVSFASSGLLANQIRSGAPFELFLSADDQIVELLQRTGFTREDSREFASGSLLLIAQSTSSHADDLSLSQVAKQISRLQSESEKPTEHNFRITLPNPVHAPYGKAARMALRGAAAWPIPDGHLLAAENAAQTLQFVNTGAVDVGIVPRSLLSGTQHTLAIASIPANLYDPVAHTMTRLVRQSESADRLFTWLQSDAAMKILLQHGLSKPAVENTVR